MNESIRIVRMNSCASFDRKAKAPLQPRASLLTHKMLEFVLSGTTSFEFLNTPSALTMFACEDLVKEIRIS